MFGEESRCYRAPQRRGGARCRPRAASTADFCRHSRSFQVVCVRRGPNEARAGAHGAAGGAEKKRRFARHQLVPARRTRAAPSRVGRICPRAFAWHARGQHRAAPRRQKPSRPWPAAAKSFPNHTHSPLSSGRYTIHATVVPNTISPWAWPSPRGGGGRGGVGSIGKGTNKKKEKWFAAPFALRPTFVRVPSSTTVIHPPHPLTHAPGPR